MPTVGFYGHSNCAYRSDSSLIDILANKIGYTVINNGVRQGSEERILFELKKSRNLDLAIIFHSDAQFIFIPNADRDISVKQITKNKSNYIFSDQFHQLHHKKFVELFRTSEEFEAAATYLKTYFYHPDLQLNRFYGSLMQIDQYLLSKSIPALHIITPNLIPSWFEFKSGIVDIDIMNTMQNYTLQPNKWGVNAITDEGNLVIANKLEKLLDDNNLIKKVNGTMEVPPLVPSTVA